MISTTARMVQMALVMRMTMFALFGYSSEWEYAGWKKKKEEEACVRYGSAIGP